LSLIREKLISFDSFIKYASTNPLRHYGLAHSLSLGKKADLVLWKSDKPYMAIIDGVVA